MFFRLILSLALTVCSMGAACAEHVIMCGGPALKQWEGLRIKADRHDNWWANFVRASTIRIAQILHKDPNAKITWIVYRPGYVTRGKEDGKPYVKWIADLAKKYKVRLKWADTSAAAIAALNNSPRSKQDKVQSFYYFGHSNCYAFMLDYGNEIMAVSVDWIHESDLTRIRKDIFTPDAECWSYGCYTGASMSGWWKKILGIPLWGNMGSTRYGPVSAGRLPEGADKWVK